MSYNFNTSNIPQISTFNSQPPIQPPQQPQFSQFSQLQQPPQQPQFNNKSIFQNADFATNSTTIPPKQKTQRAPKSKATSNTNTKQTASKTQITEAYDILTTSRNSLTTYISQSKPMYSYTETLFSPFASTCPIKHHLICDPASGTNLMLFDNMLLSVKLSEIKPFEEKIYQVSIADLKKYYNITDKSITAFKTYYKVATPVTETDKPAKPIVVHNTNTYPLTDKGGKWLTISYLIPFLFFTAPTFINHTSNMLFNLFVATSYNQQLSSQLNSLQNTSYIQQQLPDLKLKPHTTPKTVNEETQNTPKQPQTFKHKLILQQPKPIIPRLLNQNDSISSNTLNSLIQTYNINSIINNSITDINSFNTIKQFYSRLNAKDYNPADMLYVNAYLKLKEPPKSQISIVKIETSKINPVNSQIVDASVIEKLQGVKEKKVKTNGVETIIKSQPTCNYIEQDIIETATLQNIHKYAVATNRVQMTEEKLKSIKTKIEGDQNMFNTLIALTQQQDVQTQEIDPATNQLKVLPGFNTFIANSKKTSSRKKTQNTETDTNWMDTQRSEEATEEAPENVNESIPVYSEVEAINNDIDI